MIKIVLQFFFDIIPIGLRVINIPVHHCGRHFRIKFRKNIFSTRRHKGYFRCFAVNYEFAVAKALEKAGITDYTIDETNKVVQILEFDTEKNTNVAHLVKGLLDSGKGDFYGDDYEPIKSTYLGAEERAGVYRSWLQEGEQDGERRNYISEALRKVEERIAENERVKTENKAKADAESSGFFNAQNSAAKTQQNSENAANSACDKEKGLKKWKRKLSLRKRTA